MDTFRGRIISCCHLASSRILIYAKQNNSNSLYCVIQDSMAAATTTSWRPLNPTQRYNVAALTSKSHSLACTTSFHAVCGNHRNVYSK